MYTMRCYSISDGCKDAIEAATNFTGYRTIADKNGNKYNIYDIVGWKSKADSAEDFTDWTEQGTTGTITYPQASTANPRTAVLYIREEYRELFKFTQDVFPIYLFYSMTQGQREAVSSIWGSSDDRFYYWRNVDDTGETAYIKGVLQDNGYEYYFHFDFDESKVSTSSTIYLGMVFAQNVAYWETSASTNTVNMAAVSWGYTTNNTSSGVEAYIAAIDESGVDTFTVTTSGDNFTADNASKYESGENVTVTITANSGYEISSVACDDETAVITENANGTFTVTFAISQDTTITVVTVESGATVNYLNVVKDNSNCTFAYFDANGNELSESEIPLKSYVKIVCTANDGYYFEVAPRIVVTNTIASQTNYNFAIDESNPDNNYPTIYSYEIAATSSSYYINRISLYAYGTLQDSDFEGYGSCNFYIVTKNDLKTIGDSRNKIKTLDYSYVFTDMGDYISTLACVYMDVQGANETETLVLGGYSTGLTVTKITNLFQTVDCGVFTIDEIFNNAYDYENVAIRAYLPFYGFTDLETAKYMNKTTRVYYKVFVQTGDSLIIFEDTDGNILDTFSCNIAYDIPYLVKGETFDESSTRINTNLLYGFTPFIEISYNNAVNSIATKGYNDETVLIGDLGGFVKCSEVFNTIQTTQQERALIDNLLKNGILI